MSLGKLLRQNDLIMMSMDFEVIDRIFNLLTENKSVEKIEGILSTTEIVKYGGDINESKAKDVYYQILGWYATVTL